jgi:ketosteroid isomerase-like protein
MDHPNLARARQAMEAFAAGDMEAYKQHFADDVVWHVSGHHPLSGTYRGKEALFEYFDRIGELTGGTLTVETQRILADEGHVGIFARVRAQRDGRNLDVKLAQALNVSPEGNWTEYWALSDDQEAVDAFWS